MTDCTKPSEDRCKVICEVTPVSGKEGQSHLLHPLSNDPLIGRRAREGGGPTIGLSASLGIFSPCHDSPRRSEEASVHTLLASSSSDYILQSITPFCKFEK